MKSIEPCIKCRTIDYKSCHSMNCPMRSACAYQEECQHPACNCGLDVIPFKKSEVKPEKTNHFVLKEDGNLYWVKDMPEKFKSECRSFSPKYPCDGNGKEEAVKLGYCLCHEQIEIYEEAKESAIDQSVLVQNQDETQHRIAKKECGIKFGEIYSIECDCVIKKPNWIHPEIEVCVVTFPENSSQKVENSAHSFTEGSDIFHNKPDLTAKEFLETQGYELLDKDFWMEDYVTDHKFKDLCDLMERYAKQKVQEKTYTREEVEGQSEPKRKQGTSWPVSPPEKEAEIKAKIELGRKIHELSKLHPGKTLDELKKILNA